MRRKKALEEEKYFTDYQVMTLYEFIQNVKLGAFNDYDGSGELTVSGNSDEHKPGNYLRIYPSDINNLIVRWFNK